MAGKRGQLITLGAIAAVSALAFVVVGLRPTARWPPLARDHGDRLPYPGKAREIWESHIQSELNYWKDQLRRQDSEAWRTDYAERLDPAAPLQDVIAKRIDRTIKVNKILDVGSGPLTSINRKCDSCEVSIIAVDPLAEFFNELMDAKGITPPVRPVTGWGERLAEQFGEDQFDITYSRNAVDHSYDPIKCIDEMIKVTKKGRYVIVEMNERAGTLENWTGLHQWDFFIGRTLPLFQRHLFIEGKAVAAVDVSSHFAGRAEMTSLELTRGSEPWITLVLRKRAD